MNKAAIQDVIQAISPELTWMIFQIFLTLLLFSLLKDFVGILVNYLRLRFSLWGLNTKIKVDGVVGYIKNIKFDQIEIESIDSKKTVYVPISRFLNMTKVVIHNGCGEDD